MEGRRTHRREMLIGLGVSCFTVPTAVHARLAGQDHDDGDQEKMVEYLFVQTARSAVLRDGVLALDGLTPTTIFFSDRPERIVGHLPTDTFLAHWGEGEDSFEAIPPNAALSIVAGPMPQEIVVVLRKPALDGARLTYDVEVLDGNTEAEGSAASLFIDTFGRPMTPHSYAGHCRRVARRRTTRRVVRRRAWH